jgi:hypothetical protein
MLSSLSLLAQPTITGSVIPSIGSSSTFRFFNAENTLQGDSGANVTWDYSNLTLTGTGIFDYKDPATMPAGSQFATANLGVDQNGDPQIYIIADNQQYSAVGIQFSGISENYTNNPKELVRFPISYATQYVDSFEGNAVAGSVNANRKGDIVINGDAYGDLILPYVTFQNVLRVRTISTYEDKFLNNVVNSGIDTVYAWYKDGVEDYIFTWSHIYSSLAGDIYYGAFLDTMFVGIDEEKNNLIGLLISPNPAHDVVTIEFETKSNEQITLDILDASGRLVKHIKLTSNSGVVREDIDIHDLKSGVYTLIVKSGLGFDTKRFVVH